MYKDRARHFHTDVSQNLSRLTCLDSTRNSLMKRPVVQEIPRLLWNPNAHHHVHNTPWSPRLCITLRNIHAGIVRPVSTQACGPSFVESPWLLFSGHSKSTFQVCAICIYVTLHSVGTDIFIYAIQWWRQLTKNYIIIYKTRRPFSYGLGHMEDNMKTVTSGVNFIASSAFNKIDLFLTGVDSAYGRFIMYLQKGSLA